MPMKRGGGGQPQEYDPSNGRYGRGTSAYRHENIISTPQQETVKVSQKLISQKRTLDARAKASTDDLLPGIYTKIQGWFPYCVKKVNERYQVSAYVKGEIDIETRRYVIEIKSGSGKHSTNQFLREKIYAKSRGKTLLVYAPNMSKARKADAARRGVLVISTEDELKKAMSKENGIGGKQK